MKLSRDSLIALSPGVLTPSNNNNKITAFIVDKTCDVPVQVVFSSIEEYTPITTV